MFDVYALAADIKVENAVVGFRYLMAQQSRKTVTINCIGISTELKRHSTTEYERLL